LFKKSGKLDAADEMHSGHRSYRQTYYEKWKMKKTIQLKQEEEDVRNWKEHQPNSNKRRKQIKRATIPAKVLHISIHHGIKTAQKNQIAPPPAKAKLHTRASFSLL
jgi:hypothetical protein